MMGSTVKACQIFYYLVDIDKLARSPLTTDCLISVESLPGNIPVSASVAFVASLGVGLVGQIVSAG